MNISWNTIHDTSKGIMTHPLTDQVTVVTDLNKQTTKVFKNGELIREVNANMTVSQYTLFMIMTMEDAVKLDEFKTK